MSSRGQAGAVAAAALLLGAFGATTPLLAWEDSEHDLLAETAFAAVRAECPPATGGGGEDAASLGALCARSSADDLAPARHHRRGRTPFEQLAGVTAEEIEAAVQRGLASGSEDDPGPDADNVVAGYLVHHAVALHLAARGEESFSRALRREAVALGYLGDAFSAAHLFLPTHLTLTGWQGANVRAAHQFFGGEGAYVLNARGEAWQTFGDGMLQWYVPTYRHVVDACVESVREVYLVRAVRVGDLEPGEAFRGWADGLDRDWGAAVEDWLRLESGPYYYGTARLPALLRVPMPAAASWSIRSEKSEGGAVRRHYPQLREMRDPAPLDSRFLYTREGLPDWMVPPVVLGADPLELIRHHPDVASVHYLQKRDCSPSLAGGTVRAGGGVLLGEDGGGTYSAAAGYVWEFPLPVGAAQTGVELEWYHRLGDPDRQAIAPYVLFGLGLPVWIFDSAQLKLGYAWGVTAPFEEDGYAWGVGVATPAWQFPFTYAGVSLGLGYEQFRLEKTFDGLQAHVTIQ